MNFNIITASYNSEKTILECFNSLDLQIYDKTKINWFLIDGNSKDKTVFLVKKLNSKIAKKIVSEHDKGLFYAYNKGINSTIQSNDSIINFLDSDNEYLSKNVFEEVTSIFKNNDIDVVFSDLIYVDKNDKVVRYWKSKPDRNTSNKKNGIYFYNNLNIFDHIFGWSMPLPTIFVKADTLKKCGLFDTSYKICSDYEWSLRLSLIKNLKVAYIPKVFVKMRLGGVSNRISNLLKIKFQDLKIIFLFLKNKNLLLAIFFCIFTLLFKNLRKISQFF